MTNVLVGLVIGTLLGGIIGWLLGLRKGATSGDSPLQPLVEELRKQLDGSVAALERSQSDFATAQASLASESATLRATQNSATEQRSEDEQGLMKARAEVAELESRLSELERELSDEKVAKAKAVTQLEVIEPSIAQLRDDARAVQKTNAELNSKVIDAEKAKSDLNARVEALGEKLAVQHAELQKIHEAFRKEFEAVSNRLLVENANHFKEQSSEGLSKLLDPLRENIRDFKTKLEETSAESGKQNAVLKDQISRISGEAANLVRALKGDVKVLGNWGEQRLDLILEKSGLQLGVHYERQLAAMDADMEQRRFLDVIVKLPDGKSLVIDSKVSLTSYEAHVNEQDEAVRRVHLSKHIDCLRKHTKDLGGKRYQDLYGISSPDFVLMYIPLEAAFFAAVADEPDLFTHALDRNVVLITNSTLLATLRTVSSVWRLAAQQENAAEIARRGGLLYDKFHGFIGDLENLGDSLKKSNRHFEEAANKLHQGRGNLVKQAEELKSLGAKASKSLQPELIEKSREGERETAQLN